MSSYSVHFLLPPFLFSLVSFPLLSPSVFLSSFASVSSYHFNLCCCFFTSLLLLLNFLLCLFTSLLLLVLLLLLLFLLPPPLRGRRGAASITSQERCRVMRGPHQPPTWTNSQPGRGLCSLTLPYSAARKVRLQRSTTLLRYSATPALHSHHHNHNHDHCRHHCLQQSQPSPSAQARALPPHTSQ